MLVRTSYAVLCCVMGTYRERMIWSIKYPKVEWKAGKRAYPQHILTFISQMNKVFSWDVQMERINRQSTVLATHYWMLIAQRSIPHQNSFQLWEVDENLLLDLGVHWIEPQSHTLYVPLNSAECLDVQGWDCCCYYCLLSLLTIKINTSHEFSHT